MSDRSFDQQRALELPMPANLRRKAYERELLALQVELVRMQRWARDSGATRRADLRRPRHRRQGRHHPTPHRAPQPSVRATRRAPRALRRADRPVVLPALRRAASDSWRDHVVRPVLVQPGRRRASHGVRQRRAGRALLSSSRAVRGVPRERRHPPHQDLARSGARGAAEADGSATGGPVAAVEAQPDGRGRTRQVGRVHEVDGRDVHAHRQRGRLRGGSSTTTASASGASTWCSSSSTRSRTRTRTRRFCGRRTPRSSDQCARCSRTSCRPDRVVTRCPHALRHQDRTPAHDLGGHARRVEASRRDRHLRVGVELRPLLPDLLRPDGPVPRGLDDARRDGERDAAHSSGRHGDRQHLPPSRGAREDGGDGRRHLQRPARARHRRRVESAGVRRVRHRSAPASRAVRHVRRGVRGAHQAAVRHDVRLRGALLPAHRRAL